MGEALFTRWFRKFDDLGMTVIVAAGNEGLEPDDAGGPTFFLDTQLPTAIMTDDSPYIVVGGTYHNGEIWPDTTPPRGKNVMSIWAQAQDVWSPDAGTQGYSTKSGTSLAAPQIAGLAAYFLAYPWPAGKNPFDPNINGAPSVGRRVKLMLQKYAYQRLPRSEIAAQAMVRRNAKGLTTLPWDIPPTVPVAYNMAFGDQKCKIVPLQPGPGLFPIGFKARKNIFEQYGEEDSCAIPDTSGSGGNGDGMTTGTVFVTNSPTYMPSDWTGFSTPTGSGWTTETVAPMSSCDSTTCVPMPTSDSGDTSNSTPILTPTAVPSSNFPSNSSGGATTATSTSISLPTFPWTTLTTTVSGSTTTSTGWYVTVTPSTTLSITVTFSSQTVITVTIASTSSTSTSTSSTTTSSTSTSTSGTPPPPSPTFTGPNPNAGVSIAYIKTFLKDANEIYYGWVSYNIGPPYWSLDSCDGLEKATVDLQQGIWPWDGLLSNVQNESNCKYSNHVPGVEGLLICDGWEAPLHCPLGLNNFTIYAGCDKLAGWADGFGDLLDWDGEMLSYCQWTK